MKQRYVFFILLAITGYTAWGQDFRAQFREVGEKRDTAGQIAVLKSWQAARPDDPELYVAYFNYYANKSRKEVISLEREQRGETSLQLTEEGGSEAAGYLNGVVYYDPVELKAGFDYIDTGITKFPNRLDMRFGKVYMLGQQENYERFTDEIMRAIDYSAVNNNQWTWADNQPMDDPKEFMLSTVQSYVVQLYNAGDMYADNIRKIAETVLKYYPDEVKSLANASLSYMIQGQHDSALVFLLKAEKLEPTDVIILNNIAWCYREKGDTDNAVKYYELVVKHGEGDVVEQAQENLERLKK